MLKKRLCRRNGLWETHSWGLAVAWSRRLKILPIILLDSNVICASAFQLSSVKSALKHISASRVRCVCRVEFLCPLVRVAAARTETNLRAGDPTGILSEERPFSPTAIKLMPNSCTHLGVLLPPHTPGKGMLFCGFSSYVKFWQERPLLWKCPALF